MQQRYRVILALCAVITSIESNVVALPGLLFLRDLFLVLVLFCFFFSVGKNVDISGSTHSHT